MKRWILLSVLACSLAGGALALYSTNLTFKVTGSGLESSGGCYVNEWISCDAVHATSLARMFGIPVAWWGLLFYVWCAASAIFAGLTKEQQRARAAIAASFVLGAGAVMFSLYKALHLIELKVLCPVCVGMYLLNFAILGLLLKSFPDEEKSQLAIRYVKAVFGRAPGVGFAPQPTLFAALMISLFSLGYISIKIYEENSVAVKNRNLARAVEAHFNQTEIPLNYDDSAPVWGNPNAETTVVEFSDFQCPACRDAAFHMRSALFEYRNRLRLIYMNYPLDLSINSYVRRGIHPKAGLAARAGACAHAEGDFWRFHDEIFRSQDDLGRELYLQLAEKFGWDKDRFRECLDEKRSVDKVRSDIQHAHEAGVSSTPSIFVNGRLVRFWRNTEFLRAVIQGELRGIEDGS
ncbi:MAG: thioredoxin domain-containing protein [bacterium]